MPKIINNLKPEEIKPISFRMKPSVAEKIKDISFQNKISMGEVIERLIYIYESNTEYDENNFFIGTINKMDPESEERFKHVLFTGHVIFRSPRIEFKPALPYADMLTHAFKIKNIDFSECVVGSNISIAKVDDDLSDDDYEQLLIQEKLILKKQNSHDFLIYSQWVKNASSDDKLVKYLSPFASANDIVVISSLFADDIEAYESDSFIPDFGN